MKFHEGIKIKYSISWDGTSVHSEEGELLLSDLVISAADGSIPKSMTTKVSKLISNKFNITFDLKSQSLSVKPC